MKLRGNPSALFLWLRVGRPTGPLRVKAPVRGSLPLGRSAWHLVPSMVPVRRGGGIEFASHYSADIDNILADRHHSGLPSSRF
jgi:hypothetical protein